MTDAPSPVEPGADGAPSFSSPVIVKRRKMSYGKPGILLLAAGRLRFITADPAECWDIAVADIHNLKRPGYGLGSYLVFDVAGAYYAFAFGRRGPDLAPLSAGSGLAMRYGGAGGAVAGLAGDAVVVSALIDGAQLGGHWFALLGGR